MKNSIVMLSGRQEMYLPKNTYANTSGAFLKLSWTRRLTYFVFAFAATGVFMAQFGERVSGAGEWAIWARLIGIAAGVSWPIFGVLLLVYAKAKPNVFAWIDVCLAAMTRGSVLLVLIAALDRFVFKSTINGYYCAGFLVLTNLVMAERFICLSHKLGLSKKAGGFFWFGIQNGLFFVLLIILRW